MLSSAVRMQVLISMHDRVTCGIALHLCMRATMHAVDLPGIAGLVELHGSKRIITCTSCPSSVSIPFVAQRVCTSRAYKLCRLLLICMQRDCQQALDLDCCIHMGLCRCNMQRAPASVQPMSWVCPLKRNKPPAYQRRCHHVTPWMWS